MSKTSVRQKNECFMKIACFDKHFNTVASIVNLIITAPIIWYRTEKELGRASNWISQPTTNPSVADYPNASSPPQNTLELN